MEEETCSKRVRFAKNWVGGRKAYILLKVIILLLMVINNTQVEILKLLLSDPTKDYNIREISKRIEVNYRLVYQAVGDLEKDGIASVRKIGQTKLCKINLSSNICLFSYIENLRKEDFGKKHKGIKLIETDLKKINYTYFTCIVFGSYAKGTETAKSDIDLFFIVPNQTNVEDFEKWVNSALGLLSYNFDINTATEESFFEMRSKSDLNVLNEAIKNHIILFGSEQYYRMLIK